MKKKGLGSLLAVAVLAVSVISGCTAPTSKGSEASGNAVKKEDPKYPTKPVEVIVPFAAGGGTDLFSRAMADYLTKEWGQPINIINKPGAAGATGTQEVLKQGTKDGYTVLAHTVSSTSALMSGNSHLPFKLEDFKFISTVTGDPLAFVVKADAPWKDMKEFSEWVKKNPDQLTFASNGPTAIATFGVVQWIESIGGDYSKARLVVTNGTGDLAPKVAGGHIVLAVQDVGGISNLVKAGKLKILAVASPERSPYFPDVPTMEEQGIKGITAQFWGGVSVANGTPDYIVKKWESTIEKMMKDPVFQEKLKSINAEGKYMNSADFTKTVKEELAKYTDIVKQKGLVK